MDEVVKIFRALSDETRLRIYLLLLKQELCVCEIVNILNIEQSRVSHCLRILKEAVLVVNRREGTWVIYSANPRVLKNKIIQGIKAELKPSADDLKNLSRCVKENIRESCKIISKGGSNGS